MMTIDSIGYGHSLCRLSARYRPDASLPAGGDSSRRHDAYDMGAARQCQHASRLAEYRPPAGWPRFRCHLRCAARAAACHRRRGSRHDGSARLRQRVSRRGKAASHVIALFSRRIACRRHLRRERHACAGRAPTGARLMPSARRCHAAARARFADRRRHGGRHRHAATLVAGRPLFPLVKWRPGRSDARAPGAQMPRAKMDARRRHAHGRGHLLHYCTAYSLCRNLASSTTCLLHAKTRLRAAFVIVISLPS